jgi:hypothetical protein
MTSILKADTIQDTDGNNIINESSNTITIGASGDTISIPSGATIANSGTATGFGGDNTPAFKAYLSSSPSISDATITTITLNAEIFDTDSAYDTSNGKFTVPSGEGGKYFINVATRLTNWNVTQQNLYVYVGSTAKLIHENGDHQGDNNSVQHSAILNLSAGDEVTMRFYQNGGNGATLRTGEENTFFSAYKLIGV